MGGFFLFVSLLLGGLGEEEGGGGKARACS